MIDDSFHIGSQGDQNPTEWDSTPPIGPEPSSRRFEYHCSNCGKLLRVPLRLEGTQGTCNGCGALVVPFRQPDPSAGSPPPEEEPSGCFGFTCPFCKELLEIPLEYEGTEGTCPACFAEIVPRREVVVSEVPKTAPRDEEASSSHASAPVAFELPSEGKHATAGEKGHANRTEPAALGILYEGEAPTRAGYPAPPRRAEPAATRIVSQGDGGTNWQDQQLHRFTSQTSTMSEEMLREHRAVLLRSGEMVAGRFQVVSQLGLGGMGAVYRVRNVQTGSDRALKVMLPSLTGSESARQRFIQEVILCQKLNHDNIVRVYDYDEDAGRGIQFYTMEYIHGYTLAQYLAAQGGTLPLEMVLDLADQVCDALEYAHPHTVHRDLKPQNVMIDEQARIKVLDFGLARLMSQEQLVSTRAAVGTAYYQAPEQLADSASVDARADIYSLGVMLYELLTGRVPVGAAAPPAQVAGGVSRRLDAVVMQCIEARAENRPQSIPEVREALRTAGSGSAYLAKRVVGGARGAGEVAMGLVSGLARAIPWKWVIPVAVLLVAGAVVAPRIEWSGMAGPRGTAVTVAATEEDVRSAWREAVSSINAARDEEQDRLSGILLTKADIALAQGDALAGSNRLNEAYAKYGEARRTVEDLARIQSALSSSASVQFVSAASWDAKLLTPLLSGCEQLASEAGAMAEGGKLAAAYERACRAVNTVESFEKLLNGKLSATMRFGDAAKVYAHVLESGRWKEAKGALKEADELAEQGNVNAAVAGYQKTNDMLGRLVDDLDSRLRARDKDTVARLADAVDREAYKIAQRVKWFANEAREKGIRPNCARTLNLCREIFPSTEGVAGHRTLLAGPCPYCGVQGLPISVELDSNRFACGNCRKQGFISDLVLLWHRANFPRVPAGVIASWERLK